MATTGHGSEGHDHGEGRHGQGHGGHGQGGHGQGGHGQGGHAGHGPGEGHHGHEGHQHQGGAAHGHGHHENKDLDWGAMAEYLEQRATVYAPQYTGIIEDLKHDILDRAPARIIDAGAGPGILTCRLAEAFPEAEAYAVDAARPLLERAQERAKRLGLDSRVRTHEAELPEGLDGIGPADVMWLGQSLHHMGDQRAALARLAESLAPGGVLVLLEGGLSARFLPRDFGFGRPFLENRMEVVRDNWFNEMRESLHGTKRETEDWSALLTAAGLRPAATRSYLIDLPAPPSPEARAHIVDILGRGREMLGEHLDAEDRAALDRLLDPADELSVHRRDDVFVLGAQTVHFAVKP
ncbi:class I SAM-dependent methyltransferase [Streptomyces indicus]|uniref:Methyltransferase domain-containing protein n=1 Tax=Streptomyces indicus TaxID=417292 RepID=A0A1G8UIB7_9ACTN|nr:class I SAM-dependent methyltransferase [Streptomyces indicus]SDJ52885.1 Methyltransferase domain-containing protein [Streptomyces indicus]